MAEKPRIRKRKGGMSFKDQLEFDSNKKEWILVQVRRVWQLYRQNLERGMDEEQSIKEALEIGIPEGMSGWDDREGALWNWKCLGLWPPPSDKEDESD